MVIICVAFVMTGIANKGKDSDKIRIAVIPKATTHDFWVSVYNGAKAAADEAGVEIKWTGPDRESDRERQIQIVTDFLTSKVSGIVLAPTDRKALVPTIEKIYDASIACVIIDSAVDTDKYLSFVATDNYQGGVIAARRMNQILNGKGKIVVVKYMPNSASTTNRENGFIDTITNEFPDIHIVEARYGMDTTETALQAAEDILTKNTDLDGIFACNESTSRGALRALENQGRAGKIKMIGFDSEQLLVKAVREGTIDSLVV